MDMNKYINVKETRVKAATLIVAALLVSSLLLMYLAPTLGQEERKKVFHSAYPWVPPPEGHFNTFVPRAITLGVYFNIIQEPLALYFWANDSYKPWLATEWRVEGDKFIVKLREGVLWHDNTEFTAKDVVCTFNIRWLLNAPVWKYIDDVRAVDDYTVEFHIKEPSIVMYRYILRENIRPYKTYGQYADQAAQLRAQGLSPTDDEVANLRTQFNDFRPTEYIGTGPFMVLTDEITEAEMWLKKWDKHWNAKNIKFEWIKNHNGETPDVTPMVLAKEIDYATHGFPPATEKEFISQGINIKRPPVYSGPCLYFNHRIWPLSEKKFRQAIAYAINRTENGWVSLMQSGKAIKYMSGMTDSLAELWLSSSVLNSLNKYDYDPDKAAQLLEEMGFQKGADGFWRYPNGTRVEFELSFPAEYADWSAAAENVAEQLTNFGIKITPRSVTYTIHPQEVREGKFQLAIRHWGSGSNPHPHFHYYAVFIYWNRREEQIGIDYPLERDTECCGHVNIEELVYDCAKGLDPSAQRPIIETLAKIYNEELPGIQLWERYGNNVALDGVRVTNWPPDDDPLMKNALYGDNFVVMCLMTGAYLDPVVEEEAVTMLGLPMEWIIAIIVVIVIIIIAVILLLRRKKKAE